MKTCTHLEHAVPVTTVGKVDAARAVNDKHKVDATC